MAKSINLLNDAINSNIYLDTENTSALYYGNINNILTKNELMALKKSNKYKSIYGDTEDIEKYANQTMKNTQLKRGICQSLLNSSSNSILNINLPYATNDNINNEYISYVYKITDNNTNFEDMNKMNGNNKKYNETGLFEDCRRFYGIYCENVKKKLKQQFGDKYDDDVLFSHNPDCACYGDTLEDRYQREPEKYKDFKDFINNNNDDRECQLKGCDNGKNFSPGVFKSKACGDIMICKNEVKFDETVMDHSDLNFIFNLSNKCGSDSDFNKGYNKQIEEKEKQKSSTIDDDGKKEEPTSEPEPEEPEPKQEDPKVEPEEPETPKEPEVPDEPTSEPKIDPKPDEPLEDPTIEPEPKVEPEPEPKPEDPEPSKSEEPEPKQEEPEDPKEPEKPIIPDTHIDDPESKKEDPKVEPEPEPSKPEEPKKSKKNNKWWIILLSIAIIILILIIVGVLIFK